MKSKPAEIIREYGPFPGVSQVHGVSYDGSRVWIAVGEKLHALDPATGAVVQSIDVAAQAGTAFDGKHLYQIAGDVIQKIDPASGRILSTIPAPYGEGNSGMAWAEGMLWVGRYKERAILQVDPATGAVLRTIASDRYVTGVTWVDGGLWHGTWEDDASELRQVDPRSGEVLASLALPAGVVVSGLESDGGDVFYCGGATSGKLRAVRKPRAMA
ncbi:PQQ-binding-like beta-propeller repeat protein [Achromobacter sp. UMC71]|uniref:Vgb family protein n=1 Tax=Achromobacter sp. UMC71 TaxID=1862320 RepID=UPI0016045C46|nr:PQQ-binding-like beta-propeller repeat protein [Achromobacter sp. UMC71]MBB1624239.1 glutamine cyclotransferase [Achromobacter sp. UMC71]